MDFDSIIYIVIAIVLAIINAVAQKKKKTGALNTPNHQPVDQHEYVEEEELEPQPDPFEVVFQNVFANDEESQKEVEITNDILFEAKEREIQENSMDRIQLEMQAKAMELLNAPPIQADTFSFDDDSIAASQIGDALTLEEEAEKDFASKSKILKEFDPKKAILYAEIIKPKYFIIQQS